MTQRRLTSQQCNLTSSQRASHSASRGLQRGRDTTQRRAKIRNQGRPERQHRGQTRLQPQEGGRGGRRGTGVPCRPMVATKNKEASFQPEALVGITTINTFKVTQWEEGRQIHTEPRIGESTPKMHFQPGLHFW